MRPELRVLLSVSAGAAGAGGSGAMGADGGRFRTRTAGFVVQIVKNKSKILQFLVTGAKRLRYGFWGL